MGVYIGIDVGGSTTKIVGFDEKGKIFDPMIVRATDPITSIYGAFGKFTSENGLVLSEIAKVAVTGVGSSYIKEAIYGLDCEVVGEFLSKDTNAQELGLYMSGAKRMDRKEA